MTKELHIDILCYLREASKWDKKADELFARLMDTTVIYTCSNTKH